MGRIVLLTDRPATEALPSLSSLGLDVKVEPLAPDSLTQLPDLSPSAVIVDAEENPEQGFRILSALAAAIRDLTLVVVTARSDLERFPWHEVADELVFSGASVSELRVRLGEPLVGSARAVGRGDTPGGAVEVAQPLLDLGGGGVLAVGDVADLGRADADGVRDEPGTERHLEPLRDVLDALACVAALCAFVLEGHI